jgi:hypothetical protein
MEKEHIDNLIGKQCRIVTKYPDDKKATVFYGTVKLIDHNAGFIIVESKRGTGCLNMKTIETIKPKNKNT